MQGEPRFPYVLGSDGAGVVAAVGDKVEQHKVGDRAYGIAFLSPKGGFYAEYAAVKADLTSPIPTDLSVEQAAVMPTGRPDRLQGLDALGLKAVRRC